MRKYTKEKLIQILKQIYAKTGKTPSKRGISALKGYPNPSTFEFHFGSWNKAMKAAGLKPNKQIGKKEVQKTKKKSFWKKIFGYYS